MGDQLARVAHADGCAMIAHGVQRRAHVVKCEICRIEGEASVHTLTSEGSKLAAWARPPLGWWVMFGPMTFRCPACLRVEESESQQAEAS
jgi:hypothetical protein